MLETPHVVVGAALAYKFGNPALAIPLAFTSHFFLERVPHWNPHLNTETDKYGKPTMQSTILTVIDSSVALLSGSYIAFHALPNYMQTINILACSLASVMPDLIEAPYFFLNMRYPIIKKWIMFQKSLQEDTTPFWGFITQGLTIATAIWWIIS